MTGMDVLLGGGKRPAPPLTGPRTAVVVRSDPGGVFVAPLGGDRTKPLGPCRGATYRDAATCPGGTSPHNHPLQQLPVGTEVLLVATTSGYWVAAANGV